MKNLFNFFVLFLIVSIPSFGQITGKALIAGTETSSLNFEAEGYDLQFPIQSSDLKGAFMAKFKNFQYAVEASLENAGDCGTDAITNWSDSHSGSSLASFAKSGKPFEASIEGKELHGAIERAFEQCGWPDGKASVVLSLFVPGKPGKIIMVSQIKLTIPAGAKTASLDQNKEKVMKYFTQGLASNKVDNPALASSVEKYMEQKWPSEDITTIHITDLQIGSAANSNFKMDGFYITKKSNGVCKYNSFYGDGVRSSGKYSITFFNSMDAETSMDCELATELKNR